MTTNGHEIEPGADLRGANLVGANLTGVRIQLGNREVTL